MKLIKSIHLNSIIFITLSFLLCFNTHADEVDYNLTLSVERGRLITKLSNNSDIELKIRSDALPSSLLVRGIRLNAFFEKDLTRAELLLPIGSNQAEVTIPSFGLLIGEINLNNLIKDSCEALRKSSILIFWEYSARSGDNILRSKNGVIRVSDDHLECEH